MNMIKSAEKSVLINPIVARDINESHRASTPLELFYDLIFVVAIASLSVELHHAISNWHHVGHAVWMYFFLFFCIWWPWNTYTWFASGYDTNDAQFRVASFAQMIGAIIIAVGVKPAFLDNNFLTMMIGYITMRIPYILMWFKVAYDDAKSRPIALQYAIGVLIIQIAWSLSILYFDNWYIFIALVLFEMLVPYIAERSTDKGINTKYHFAHIEERMGLMTIIVLGESILAAAYAFENVMKYFSADSLMLATGAILILFSMWWLYFDDASMGDELASDKKTFIWSYGHYFVFGFATAVGALLSVNVDVLINNANIGKDLAVLGLAIAIFGYLVAVWFCHDLLLKKKGLKRYELLMLAVLIVGIAIFYKSVLLIGIAFVTLNIIRLARQHNQVKALIKETSI
jgi:low temperature requirement protein LtrA